jgi:DNA-damage-inducible protein J
MKQPHLSPKLLQSTEAHDKWFRAKVQQALDDPRPPIPHEQVEAHFAERRAAAARKVHPGPQSS